MSEYLFLIPLALAFAAWVALAVVGHYAVTMCIRDGFNIFTGTYHRGSPYWRESDDN